MTSHRLARLAASLLVLAVPACRAGAPPEIRIGVLATYTGPYAEVSGIPTRHGAQLAVSQAGDVDVGGHRYRVTLIERDFPDRGDAAASAARALINQDQVAVLIGPQFSRHAVPVAVVAENAHVPMISPMSSSPATTAGKRFVFRLAFLDDVQGSVLARFATEDLRARTGAVLYDVTSEYSRVLAERFRDAFTAHGGRVVAFEPYTADRVQDVTAQLERIRAAAPDVLLLPNFPDAVAQHVPLIVRLGVRATLLGSDSWDPLTLPQLPPGQEAFVTGQWRPDVPSAAATRFTDLHRRMYGEAPRATAAMTYDAVGVVLAAIRRAGSLDPEAVRNAIAATQGYAGASGTLDFGGRGDPRREVAVARLRDGALATVRVMQP